MMNRLELIEKIRNLFDFGYVQKTLRNSIRAGFEMGFMEFFKHLFWGSGYTEMTPLQLEKKMLRETGLLVIDLREPDKFMQARIDGARSHPFEQFVKAVLVDTAYSDFREKPVLLVCDTGHQSRVAASILAENGFSHPISLNRGMHRYFRWQHLKTAAAASEHTYCRLCHGLLS